MRLANDAPEPRGGRKAVRRLGERHHRRLRSGDHAILVVATRIAKTPYDVATLATQLLVNDPACVLKILSDDISHKSDVGGVRLGLESADAARDGAKAMLERIAREHLKARIDGFTVQAMVHRPGA